MFAPEINAALASARKVILICLHSLTPLAVGPLPTAIASAWHRRVGRSMHLARYASSTKTIRMPV
jgi:hypothetical protein